MECRRLTAPAIVARLRGRRLHVSCLFPRKLARARRILRRKAKFDLLEETTGLRVTWCVDRTPSPDAMLV